MVKLKCRCGWKFDYNNEEKSHKIDCPNPECENDGIWKGDKEVTDDFVVLD